MENINALTAVKRTDKDAAENQYFVIIEQAGVSRRTGTKTHVALITLKDGRITSTFGQCSTQLRGKPTGAALTVENVSCGRCKKNSILTEAR